MAKLSHTHALLKRLFGDLPIDDATTVLQVFPNEADCKKAVPRDPRLCVVALTLARTLGATNAIVLKHYVYVDHPGKDGVRRIYRYQVTSSLKRAIKFFDRYGRFNPNYQFLLRPPRKSHSLVGMRVRRRRYLRTDAGKANYEKEKAKKNFISAQERVKAAQVEVDKAKPNAIQFARLRLKSARVDLNIARVKFNNAVETARSAASPENKMYHPHERVYRKDERSGLRWLSQEAARLGRKKAA